LEAKELNGEGHGDGEDGEEDLGLAHHDLRKLLLQQLSLGTLDVGDRLEAPWELEVEDD
jgi:hypothetical protein